MKLVRTSLFSALITFIRIASGFVASKFVALVTGPAGMALIGQFTNFITVVLNFANGAINTGVVKYTAEYENDDAKLRTVFSTSLRISIYCSLFTGTLLLLTAPYCSEWIFKTGIYANAIHTLGFTIILYSVNSLLISILNGKKQISTYTIVNTAGSVIGLLFTIILVYRYKIYGALYALVLAQSIVVFITIVLIVKSPWFKWKYFNEKLDPVFAKKLAAFSLMTIISAITAPLSQIFLRNILIQKFGINNAGYWQGMMRISDGYLLLITTSLGTYYLPKLSSLHTDAEIKKEVFQTYKIVMPIVLAGCLVIYFIRIFIIHLLYTPEFDAMAPLFIYQLLGDFFKIAAWLLGYLMIAKAMTKAYIITEIIFSIGYVLLGYVCMNLFNLQGITIAFAVNYFIYLIVMVFIFRKLLFK